MTRKTSKKQVQNLLDKFLQSNRIPMKARSVWPIGSMNYYYSKEGDIHGPKTWDQLEHLYKTGHINYDTQVCAEGEDEWRTFAAFKDSNPSISAPESTSIPEAVPPPKIIAPPNSSEIMYSVVPFVARIGKDANSGAAAAQLQTLIQSFAAAGWEYVRLESVETVHAGDDGCFGIGATAPQITVYSMAVFKR
jgi:hypothetical protein